MYLFSNFASIIWLFIATTTKMLIISHRHLPFSCSSNMWVGPTLLFFVFFFPRPKLFENLHNWGEAYQYRYSNVSHCLSSTVGVQNDQPLSYFSSKSSWGISKYTLFPISPLLHPTQTTYVQHQNRIWNNMKPLQSGQMIHFLSIGILINFVQNNFFIAHFQF